MRNGIILGIFRGGGTASTTYPQNPQVHLRNRPGGNFSMSKIASLCKAGQVRDAHLCDFVGGVE